MADGKVAKPGRRDNPHAVDTPEWQLWENWTSQLLLVAAYTSDIERYEQLRAATKKKAEQYHNALMKLTGEAP